VMVSHAAYPDSPAKNHPASASPYWTSTVLRKRIGYRGIIFSDDLEMGGILKFLSIEDAVIEAVRAGMDLMEICHSPELILRAYDALLVAAERSTAFRNTVQLRAGELSLKRRKLISPKPSASLSAKQLEALRTRILRFKDTVAKARPRVEIQPA
jgi:beta-N-acetylhexosaminidase